MVFLFFSFFNTCLSTHYAWICKITRKKGVIIPTTSPRKPRKFVFLFFPLSTLLQVERNIKINMIIIITIWEKVECNNGIDHCYNKWEKSNNTWIHPCSYFFPSFLLLISIFFLLFLINVEKCNNHKLIIIAKTLKRIENAWVQMCSH
jgi:hypothetical protein